jgi:hypothetical protein
MPATSTGVPNVPPIEPFPSWPALLLPQQYTFRELVSAHVKSEPARSRVIPEGAFETSTGTSELTVVPLPNWPFELSPQHFNAPVAEKAHECARPAATPT